mgnify:CR=1 FL=1
MELKKVRASFKFESGIYSFLNPYSYYLVRNKKFDLDGWYIDGILLVWLLRVFGINVERVSFDMTSIAPLVLSKCVADGLSLAVIGSEEQYLNKFINVISESYPRIKICYQRNGYFKDNVQMIESASDVNSSGADVVIVGMGAIHQENYLVALKESGYQGAAFSCGGFIHQTASGGGNYYPNWVDKYNIRWVYRIYDEPKLLRRYFIEYPKAIIFIGIDLIKNRNSV